MNWPQRFGIAFLVAASAVGALTYGTSTNHAVNPVPIADLGLTPEAAEQTKEFVAGLEPLQIVGADSDADNRSKRVMLTGALYRVNGNQWPFHGPQEIGDCASFGFARAIEIDQAQQIENGTSIIWRPVDRPFLYYGGRIRNGRVQISGDGSVPSWIVDWTGPNGKGVLWADEDGLPPYNGARAKQWGRSGPPPEWIAKAAPYRVMTAAAVSSAQEACNAIAAGYPVPFGSMKWGTNSIRLIEGRNVARDTTNWPHAQCIVGYDGTIKINGKGVFRIDNSWGPNAHDPKSTMPDDAPGGYYAPWDDVDAFCRNEGMAFAVSGTQGFIKRELNFDAYTVASAPPAPLPTQGETIMFEIAAHGYALAVGLMLIGIACLLVGRMRGNGVSQIGLTAGLALVMITIPANAAELSFRAFDANSAITTSTTSSDCPLSFDAFDASTPLTFSAFDACDCGPDCKCLDCDCKTKTATAEPPARRVQWLMFSTPGCVPCTIAKSDFRPWLERSGWEVSPTPQAQVRLIDAEADAELASEFNVRQFPTFVLVRDGKEVDRHEGYPGKAHLAQKYIATVEKQSALQPEKRRYVPPVK